MSEYAPFPEAELLLLEEWHYERVRAYGYGPDCSAVKTIRDAIASYKALNQRCLIAELALNHGVKEPAS